MFCLKKNLKIFGSVSFQSDPYVMRTEALLLLIYQKIVIVCFLQ